MSDKQADHKGGSWRQYHEVDPKKKVQLWVAESMSSED